MPKLPTSPFVSARRAPRRRWVRWVELLAAITIVLAVIAKGGAAGLSGYADRRLQRVSLAALGGPRTHGAASSAAGAAPHASGVTPPAAGTIRMAIAVTTAGERPLSTALVSAPDRAGEALVVALPVELQVEVPGRGITTLANALREGGPDLLVQSVAAYARIPVHHYVEVDLAALTPLAVHCAPVRATAAATVQAQLEFLGQAAQQLLAPRTLLNPLRLRQTVDRVAAAVRTDDTVSGHELLAVVRALKAADRIRVVAVPETLAGGIVRADPDGTEPLFRALPLGTDPSVVVRPPRPPTPAGLEVRILNGAGVVGLAASASELLVARGFRVSGTGNLEGFGLRRTEVRYGPGRKSEAELVARYLRGAVLAEVSPPSPPEVVVALGHDWAEEPKLVDRPALPARAAPQPARGPCA